MRPPSKIATPPKSFTTIMVNLCLLPQGLDRRVCQKPAERRIEKRGNNRVRLIGTQLTPPVPKVTIARQNVWRGMPIRLDKYELQICQTLEQRMDDVRAVMQAVDSE